MTVTIYGIRACDTMKKAFTWLDEKGIAYQFHDYKKSGVDARQVAHWIQVWGWEKVINRRGTTWRKLPEAQRDAMDATSAVDAAVANTSLLKRPLVEISGTPILLGFDPELWAATL
ncbi:ArsC family reductase [Isoalcanivorax beigongshangi]|uniref:ArsC family reductase n=1 Tax=Isoalcanivorax beigongshangi TaxID=3238810 RepID=A0ABV4AI12_9GAMM